MNYIKFTITEDEINEVAEEINVKKLSTPQIKEVLTMVECDEVLWKDIHESIISAIRDL